MFIYIICLAAFFYFNLMASLHCLIKAPLREWSIKDVSLFNYNHYIMHRFTHLYCCWCASNTIHPYNTITIDLRRRDISQNLYIFRGLFISRRFTSQSEIREVIHHQMDHVRFQDNMGRFGAILSIDINQLLPVCSFAGLAFIILDYWKRKN